MFRIGWASRDFTPDRPALLQGQMHRRIAYSAKDPLTVTALAIESAGECAILISGDLACAYDVLLQAIRAQLAVELPEVPAEKIVLHTTHTHTSLVMEDVWYEHPGGEVMTAGENVALVAGAAADAAVEAWQARVPQTVTAAYGHAVVAHNRRAVYSDGHAQMYGRTDVPEFTHIEGFEDHSLDMVFIRDTAGQLTGMVVDIPCPSQVDEHLEVFSADFWHEIRQELRARFGAGLFVLPLCGLGGDQSPHFLVDAAQEAKMRERRGVSERQEIALRVADAVARALPCAVPVEGAFRHTVRRLDLPPRQVLRAERDWSAGERARALAQEGPGWWPDRLQRVVDTYEGSFIPPPVPVELHFLRLGDIALATNPFELFVDYALRIKARSPAAQTLLAQLTCGTGLYLPTERAVQGGGYGAMAVVSEVGPDGGQILVDTTLAALRELFVD